MFSWRMKISLEAPHLWELIRSTSRHSKHISAHNVEKCGKHQYFLLKRKKYIAIIYRVYLVVLTDYEELRLARKKRVSFFTSKP